MDEREGAGHDAHWRTFRAVSFHGGGPGHAQTRYLVRGIIGQDPCGLGFSTLNGLLSVLTSNDVTGNHCGTNNGLWQNYNGIGIGSSAMKAR